MSWDFFFKKNMPNLSHINELTIASVEPGIMRGGPCQSWCLCVACASGHVDTSQKGTAPDQIWDCGLEIRLIELRLHSNQVGTRAGTAALKFLLRRNGDSSQLSPNFNLCMNLATSPRMSAESAVSKPLLEPGSLAPTTPRHPDFTEPHSSDDTPSAPLLGSELTLSHKPLAIYPPSHGDLSLSTPSKKSTFHPYNRGGTSRIIALGGLVISVLFSICSIAVGTCIAIYKPHGIFNIVLAQHNASETELLALTLNLIVTACTESIGFVHAKSLQYALASESRLHFNTNLRLFTAVRRKRWTSPNGVLFNTLMAILLIMSYVSSSLVFASVQYPSRSTLILAPAVIMLGVTLLLQAVIAYAGVRNVQIITWSSSPFDTTAALLHNDQLAPVSGQCMRDVLESRLDLGPKTPTELQRSAWKAHPTIKATIILLWSIVPACVMWSGIVLGVGSKYGLFQNLQGEHHKGIESWSLLPNSQTSTAYVSLALSGTWFFFGWCMSLITIIVIQSALTMGLHCSEVISNVVRDETAWRRATSKGGVSLSNNPLATVFGSWPNVGLFIAKPVLREL